jgi:hypothetical protein
MNFGAALPIGVDDGAYKLRLVDLDKRIQDPEKDLKPFASIASIDNQLNDCLQHIRCNPNKKYIVAIITGKYTLPEIQRMIEHDLKVLPNLYILHLFFTNGKRFHDQWRTFHSPLVISCRSITPNLSRDLKTICNTSCNLIIEFCEVRAQKYTKNDDNGIANIFQRQKHQCIELTLSYMQELLLNGYQ